MKKNYLYILIFFLIIQQYCASDAKPFDYGNVSSYNYLIGNFNPSKHSKFVNLKKLGMPVNNKKHYLRVEAAKSLKRMYSDFHKKYPKIKFFVRSSTRNFNSQKSIWERKWKSRKYNRSSKTPYAKAKNILKYSSMPGTSRHHWGTDFDINRLTNKYYSHGDGKKIYNWLKLNAYKYGFCQPYNSGRKSGYNEEKWHWSYYPLSKKFLKHWNNLFSGKMNKSIKHIRFQGFKYAWRLSKIYANSINENCK